MHLAYVDSSNLFIEAQKISAVASGQAASLWDARQRGVIDLGYRLDLYRLGDFLIGMGGPLRPTIFGSRTDTNEGLWRHARTAGFEPVLFERGYGNKEKRVDTGVVTRICRDAYLYGHPARDHITLVAGDGDYEPMVRQLVEDGFAVTLLYWSHASRGLREAATRFVALDPFLDELALPRQAGTAFRPEDVAGSVSDAA